jgi:hypothetical protein
MSQSIAIFWCKKLAVVVKEREGQRTKIHTYCYIELRFEFGTKNQVLRLQWLLPLSPGRRHARRRPPRRFLTAFYKGRCGCGKLPTALIGGKGMRKQVLACLPPAPAPPGSPASAAARPMLAGYHRHGSRLWTGMKARRIVLLRFGRANLPLLIRMGPCISSLSIYLSIYYSLQLILLFVNMDVSISLKYV